MALTQSLSFSRYGRGTVERKVGSRPTNRAWSLLVRSRMRAISEMTDPQPPSAGRDFPGIGTAWR